MANPHILGAIGRLIYMQLELGNDAYEVPPDDRLYFPAENFVGTDPTALYDIPMSDSENDRYLRAMGMGKKQAWSKSNQNFEHQKAMTRKKIQCLQRHLKDPGKREAQRVLWGKLPRRGN